jgi:hypothetical protein
MVSSSVDHYYRYRERTINLLSLGTTIANLARQRRRWEPLLRSMPRTQSQARDFDPVFDRLTEVTGFGSNPGALRMFEYVPTDPQPTSPRTRLIDPHRFHQTADRPKQDCTPASSPRPQAALR